jgi:methyl-accepting chemotaxis protein/methyl-accepting chemotaxis protein-1 (serine sensor receptor)
MMSSFTIGKKLYFAVGVLVVFSCALGLTGLIGMSSVGSQVREITQVTVKQQSLTHDMATRMAEILSGVRGIETRGLLKDTDRVVKMNQDRLASTDALQADIDAILPLLVKPEAKQQVADLQAGLTTMRQAGATIYELSMGDHPDQAPVVGAKLVLPAEKPMNDALAGLLAAQDAKMASSAASTQSLIVSSRWASGVVLAVCFAVGLAVVFVVRQINLSLRNSVAEMGEAAAQIASAAAQVAASRQSQAQGASEQTATIEETSSASVEINSMAQRNTENSRSAADAVTRSQEGFEHANRSLDEMVSAMDGIHGSSQKISKIIKVIDEIAFQTNILALNAAVEAARAGEAGMGFAVVADEVRNLSQRCAQAAKDTEELIEESIERSDGGKQKVDQVAVVIHAITAEASKIKDLVEEISMGSVEQTSGIEQISRAISQMEQVTQGSAANAEESAAAAEELSAQAEALKSLVQHLRGMVDGRGAFGELRAGNSLR